jgi:hypothetical protein
MPKIKKIEDIIFQREGEGVKIVIPWKEDEGEYYTISTYMKHDKFIRCIRHVLREFGDVIEFRNYGFEDVFETNQLEDMIKWLYGKIEKGEVITITGTVYASNMGEYFSKTGTGSGKDLGSTFSLVLSE